VAAEHERDLYCGAPASGSQASFQFLFNPWPAHLRDRNNKLAPGIALPVKIASTLRRISRRHARHSCTVTGIFSRFSPIHASVASLTGFNSPTGANASLAKQRAASALTATITGSDGLSGTAITLPCHRSAGAGRKSIRGSCRGRSARPRPPRRWGTRRAWEAGGRSGETRIWDGTAVRNEP